jgi:citronellol/citronellal dehydrogenase
MSYQSVFRPGLFEGRTYLVTGGGSGIGRCTAHELASLGATVLLVGRKVEKLQKVADEIVEDGGRADFASCDVRVEDAVRAMVEQFLVRHPRIDGLVNNAGGQFPAPLAAISQKGFETVVRTNLVGGFLVARELYNQHLSQHGGSIVNIVADMHRGMPGMGHSGAARAGMVNFTMTAALEWATSGVRVNAVAPGWIASSGLDHYDESIRTTVIPMLRTSVPLKRLGTESEISAAICFLLSDAAAFITGAMLPVDGGAPLLSAVWPTPDHDRSTPFNGFHRAVEPQALKNKT